MEEENARLSERRGAIKTIVKRKTLYHCSECFKSIYENKLCTECQYCHNIFCVDCREKSKCPICDKNWNYIPFKNKYLGCFNYLCKNT
mgnify:CR=1 FL=1